MDTTSLKILAYSMERGSNFQVYSRQGSKVFDLLVILILFTSQLPDWVNVTNEVQKTARTSGKVWPNMKVKICITKYIQILIQK